jgi:chlorophyll synthase
MSAHTLARPALAPLVELLKPITWFAPMWAFGCGVVSAGAAADRRWPLIVAGVLLCGPLVCGTSQVVNDWFDREVDALNEPQRPIPSGRVPGHWALALAALWSALSLILGALLGPFALAATLAGLVLAWIYSAPPLRLKLNGWWGNAAVAACYEGLPWITGAAIAAGGAPGGPIIALAALYSIGAHGIMTLNDFKSVAGDRALGIRSLPAQLGVARAARVACAVMAAPQVVVVALMLHWQRPLGAAVVAALLIAQVLLMVRLLRAPRDRAPWYNATGTSLYVLGMLVAALTVPA